MDPQERFCHNECCWAYGRAGEGHIVIHSQKERRHRCKRCTKTFSETKGTALYRSHKPHELVATIVTLLAYGCPVQAIVAAFGLDERTVARWLRESGWQCQWVHEHLVQARGVLLAQVQADELRIRIVGGVLWLASALSVTSRLWLGGVVQVRRDRRPAAFSFTTSQRYEDGPRRSPTTHPGPREARCDRSGRFSEQVPWPRLLRLAAALSD